MTWPKVKLGDVCEINPRFTGYLPDSESVAFVPMAAVSEISGSVTEEQTLTFNEVKKGLTPFRKEDILFAKITPCFENGKIAQANISHEWGFGSTEFHVIRPNEEAEGHYLLHLLRAPIIREEGAKQMTGSAGQKRVPKHYLAQLEIPLPPLAEQKRLAAILNHADALRRVRRESLARLDELAQSLFLELFGDPATNPKGWDMVRLGELTELVSSGSTPLGGSTTYLKSGILFIRSQNVLMRAFDFSDAVFISEETHKQMRRTWVKNGDVLFNITGASIGRVNYFEGEDNSANVNQHVCVIRTNKERLTAPYLSDFLASSTFQQTKIANNKGATRQAFNFQQIKDFEIPLPPLGLQQQFAEQIAELEAIKARARASQVELEALFASLQSRAFAGEL